MIDKTKFLNTFRNEGDELIVKLENGLVAMEKDPKNLGLINELNREAHTLKGAARMMGFTAIQDRAHEIEDSFAQIGRGEKEFSPEVTTATLKQLDEIKKLIAEVMASAQPPKQEENPLEAAAPVQTIADEYIKVPLRKIDELVDLVGETVVSKSRLANQDSQLDLLITELQNKAREMRMLPASTAFDAYPRLVRDIATAQQKQVEFIMTGVETEIDKKILEEINPALIHLLRNAVDHGIKEKGKVVLSARHEGGSILIEVSDDGAGLDVAKISEVALKKKLVTAAGLQKMTEKEIINFIFLPGFSTSPIITDISGRGVGLDVVKTQAGKVRGQVKIESTPGAGTKFILKLPLTIAIISALFVKEGGEKLAIPLIAVDETLEVNKTAIDSIEGKLAYNLRDHVIPLVKLGAILDLPIIEEAAEPGKVKDHHEVIALVIISSIEKKIGLIVDKILKEEEIYVKPLGQYLGKVKNVEGAAILGTGEVVVVLDVVDLIANASRAARPAAAVAGEATLAEAKKVILIVEDSFTTRELEKSILFAQGYEVETAIDGLDAMNQLTKMRPNLIVTDIQMPRMDGFELCHAIKTNDNFKDIPVVMVTALEKEEDKRRGIEVGADAYITKSSFEQKNLLETIEKLL